MNKSARYRAKDVMGYRARKAAYARTPEQRAERTAYMRVWRENNRDRHNELARESHQRNKHVEKQRNAHYVRSYGITYADKLAMIAAQGGKCGICAQPLIKPRHTHVDHDHATGKVRGILCRGCNTKLGWYEQNSDKIVKYLEK